MLTWNIGPGRFVSGMAAFRTVVRCRLDGSSLGIMGCQGRCSWGNDSGLMALFKGKSKELVPCALLGHYYGSPPLTRYITSAWAVGISRAPRLTATLAGGWRRARPRALSRGRDSNKLVNIVFNIVGCVLAVTSGDLSGSISRLGVASGIDRLDFAVHCWRCLAIMATKTLHPLAVTFWGFVFGGSLWRVLSAPWSDLSRGNVPTAHSLFTALALFLRLLRTSSICRGLSMDLETSRCRSWLRSKPWRPFWSVLASTPSPPARSSPGHCAGAHVHPDYEHRLLQAAQQWGLVGHVVDMRPLNPMRGWTEKSQDMDAFKERTGIAGNRRAGKP